ncbi:helix-turn-helix domain-containing protein [Jeotgalibacillus haloalkalitolerans]|uniref:Helix-turn-helix transcriptional regulator n=1 Tax=Jeotgalibacillus haloalkalitolerans TaxID=3104292 RepID=A0ABU5KI49_9BACL|nr:helix-turn-helix transcriptional regulator [Jeotgalibacillus sp. HH7-29]MDZ5710919.1 helix-turn-helix transcriptional regulator [Jeotgalibacillus sp. HH7-29]
MSSLGERIRKLRKEKKMTLVDVAGDAMSKGMLSLIENGRSNPSMESLQHIAKQLGVNVQVLLAEESSEEMKKKLVEIEEMMQEVYQAKTLKEYEQLQREVRKSLEQILDQELPSTYETGRFHEIAGRIDLNDEKSESGLNHISQAIECYEYLSLNHSVYKAQMRIVLNKFIQHEYKEALEQLLIYKEAYYKKELLADPLVQIESDHLEAVLLFAVGRYEEAAEILDSIISFSKRKNIYYLMDDVYRLISFYSLLKGDEEKRRYALKKSRQFAEFTERYDGITSTMFMEIHHENIYLKQHEKALQMLDDIRQNEVFGEMEESGFIYLERGSANYGLGNIDQAYEELKQFEFPTFAHHPFDISMLATADAYMALCLIEKGEPEKALIHAEKAKAKVAGLPETPYHHFIQETWEKTKANLDNRS